MKDHRGTDRSLETPPTDESHGHLELLAALRHELELRDQFIVTAAHELRNPLSPVYMQLEHLKATLRGSSDEICHAMDGHVEVESELGNGATFTVSLPRGE